MNWRVVRPLAVATVAIGLIVGNPWRDEHLSVPVSAQGIEYMPGPIIEDPPGPYAGLSYVPPDQNLIASSAVLSTFEVTYTGFTPAAQAAFQAAVNIWASQIQSNQPIRVKANWTTLGAGVLGSAGAQYVFRDFPGAPIAGTWYAAAVAKKLSNMDLTAGIPDPADIVANFNSNFDFYLGTDGNTGGKYDLMTVVLHELGHGLGFFGSMNGAGPAGAEGRWGIASGGVTYPVVYDQFAVNGSGQALLNTTLFPNPSTALGQQLTSNNIFFNGPNARASNGNISPKLYAPATWAQGSSYSHLDETTYPNGNINSLMTYALAAGEAIHNLGPILRGLFVDEGWTVSKQTRGDYDGDGKTDITLYRPSAGTWYSLRSSTNSTLYSNYQWGVSTDTPVIGDFDGDGKADVTIYRPSAGTWYALLSSSNYTSYASYQWGLSTDVPVPGDYDGDGKTDPAIYRPSTGQWYVLRSSTNYTTFVSYQWGVSTDSPIPSDYDGDGKTDPAIYRPSAGQWYVLRSSTNYTTSASYQWGVSTDTPVPGDYDGDGKTDIALYRPSVGQWYVLRSSTNYTTFVNYQWGVSTDIPVPGDYDGDGKNDLTLYRPSTGTWYVEPSSTNYTTFTSYPFGVSTDVAVLSRP